MNAKLDKKALEALTDDDFATLVEALVEGRGFWRNMRRGVGLLLGGNAGELGLIVGASVGETFVATYRMERACAMQLAFQQSGAAFHPIRDEVVSAAYGRRPAGGGRNDPAKFEWPALLRKLDRIDPSYKQ